MRGRMMPEIERAGAGLGSAQVVVACSELAPSLEFFTDQLGMRVDVIFPAESPTTAVISGHGLTLRLEERAGAPPSAIELRLTCDPVLLPDGATTVLTAPDGTRIELVVALAPIELPEVAHEFVVSRELGDESWVLGRAGMHYRDLIPSRLGGRFVASHIRIPDGGDVPDYVHFHKIRFQMIFCRTGWARLVYEDQGEPFLLRAGDCVLQPPEIRHRVLEASPGLEVIELGCPAIHETHADHQMSLPSGLADRDFGGQRFVRHIAADAPWLPWRVDGAEVRDTGIAAATAGLAGVRVVRSVAGAATALAAHTGELLFMFVLAGDLDVVVDGAEQTLSSGDSCALPADTPFSLRLRPGVEVLEVTLPGDLLWKVVFETAAAGAT
ncbi:MAG: cupin domain-containing protein [Ilumatobacteraceae bacterium]